MNYRQRDEPPCEAVIRVGGVQFRCPRAGYVIIKHGLEAMLLCAYCADVFKCDERAQ